LYAGRNDGSDTEYINHGVGKGKHIFPAVKL
jgi:hypothetical protein